VTGVCLTKLDVLDGLKTVKICIGYQDANGKAVGIPYDAEGWEAIQPIYEEMPGWSESTVGAQSLEELPVNARNYIKRLEELMATPIDIISTGPDRVQTVVLRHPFAE